MVVDINEYLFKLKVLADIDYTEEQRDIIKNFNQNLIVFADPGSGKTHTIVGGLLAAEKSFGFNPDSIYALSFSRAATGELASRYERVCKRINKGTSVNFQTVDALCRKALIAGQRDLGFENLEIRSTIPIEEAAKMAVLLADEQGVNVPPEKAKYVVNAINSLNSKMVFDRDRVEDSPEFKKLYMDYFDFTRVRKELYEMDRVFGKIQETNIPLYTLELFERFPEYTDAWKEKIDLLIIDEFQDTSIIKLDILSRMSKNLIVVGDIKQQIYGFAGASTHIREIYMEKRPIHLQKKLTQSFRCKNEIVDFAKGIIKPNNLGEANFKGVGEGGVVEILPSYEADEIINIIAQKYQEKGVSRDHHLILFRNNISSSYIIEGLYNRSIPFRAPKFKVAMELPVIKDLCEIIQAVASTDVLTGIRLLHKHIPSLRRYIRDFHNSPLVKIYRQDGMPLHEIPFNYGMNNNLIHNTLNQIYIDLEENVSTLDIFRDVWEMYTKVTIKERLHFMYPEPEFFVNMIKPLLEKPYEQFVSNEWHKKKFNDMCIEEARGVRISTCHGSKGLEANHVILMDADDYVFPNRMKLEETITLGAKYRAAEEVRNERCLAFVAATRAKDRFTVFYNKELSSLFTGENSFESLDDIYNQQEKFYEDSNFFLDFINF